MSRATLLAAGAAAFDAAAWAALDRSHDGLSLLLVAFALLALGVVCFLIWSWRTERWPFQPASAGAI